MSNAVTSIAIWRIGVFLLLAGCASEQPKSSTIDFHKEVAPIFKARCWQCFDTVRNLLSICIY